MSVALRTADAFEAIPFELPRQIASALDVQSARVHVLDVQGIPEADEAQVWLELRPCSHPTCIITADVLATQLQLRGSVLNSEMFEVRSVDLEASSAQEAMPTPTTAFWLLLALASGATTLMVIRRIASHVGARRRRADGSRAAAQGGVRQREHLLAGTNESDDEEDARSTTPSFVLRELAMRVERDIESRSTAPSFVLRERGEA